MNLNIFISIINAISIATASIVAICGINSWKNETRWKKKNDLAEEILYLLYQCQDIITFIRTPLTWSTEGKTRKADPKETPEIKESLDRASVVTDRYEANKEAFNKLGALSFRAEIYFELPVIEAIKEINKQLRRLFISAQVLGKFYWPQRSKYMSEERATQLEHNIKENEKIIWIMSEDDEINKCIDNAIVSAKKSLKKWIN